jgi:hypothetical protein
MPRFPNLFIIGAMKAGTSSLHAYLHQHPQIFMSRFKEPQYFAPHSTRWGQKWGQGNPYPEPGIDWYLRLFAEAGDAQYAGESSVSYSARPWVCDCEKRIYNFNPAARMIYILRDPVERAISHYWQFVADGREDLDPLSAMRKKSDYIARSHYAMQLRPYLEQFGADQVFTLTLEELQAKPETMFRRLFTWLGVNAEVCIDFHEKHNVGREEYRQTRRGLVFLDTTMKHWRWKRIEPSLPVSIPKALRRFTYREIERRAVDTESAVQYLRPILQRHTRELSDLLGRDFPEWTTLYDQERSARAFVGAAG